MRLWKDIKDEYHKWPVNEYGYHVEPSTNFWLKIGEGASIGDMARVGYRARVGDRVRVDKQLTYIIGSMHQIYLYDPAKKMIGIGRHLMTIAEWQEKGEYIGRQNNYSSAQIEEYRRYIDLFEASLNE